MMQAWQQSLSDVITDSDELAQLLALDRAQLAIPQSPFGLKIPRTLLSRIESGNPNDPVLKQFLPTPAKPANGVNSANDVNGVEYLQFENDPLAEKSATPIDGLLHKYQGRVLLVLNGLCAVHCRYCFRQHFPYEQHQLDSAKWQRVLDYLRNDPTIDEVIFSGGDPLAMNDRRLAEFSQSLQTIDHIKRLRIHTRLPVVIPARINDALLGWLEALKLKVIFVFHINHANEINLDVQQAIAKLSSYTLLNQSVLLHQINDDSKTQIALQQRLFEIGILPYYLHLLDPVRGSEPFYLTKQRALSIYHAMQAALPGYLLPKLVEERPHARSKSFVFE